MEPHHLMFLTRASPLRITIHHYAWTRNVSDAMATDNTSISFEPLISMSLPHMRVFQLLCGQCKRITDFLRMLTATFPVRGRCGIISSRSQSLQREGLRRDILPLSHFFNT